MAATSVLLYLLLLQVNRYNLLTIMQHYEMRKHHVITIIITCEPLILIYGKSPLCTKEFCNIFTEKVDVVSTRLFLTCPFCVCAHISSIQFPFGAIYWIYRQQLQKTGTFVVYYTLRSNVAFNIGYLKPDRGNHPSMIILWTWNWLTPFFVEPIFQATAKSAVLHRWMVVGKQYGAQSTPRHFGPQSLVSLVIWHMCDTRPHLPPSTGES